MIITIDKTDTFIATSGKEFDPDKKTWVFIHGSAMDHTLWALFNRYFTSIGHNVLGRRSTRTWALTRRTIKTRLKTSLTGLAKLFDELKLNQAIVAGHSMGALIAYDFAARHKQYCQGVVLLGFCLPMPVNQALLDLSQANDHRAFEMIVDFGYAANSKIGAAQSPGLWMTQGGMRLMEHSNDGALFSDFTACNAYTPPDSLAEEIDCPVLFIAGSEDKMTPARGLKIWTGKIKNSQVEIITDCGHMMTIEKPNQVIRALKHFNTQMNTG